MTTFLLIRHGLNPYVGKALAGHLPGVHLDDSGKQQAADLAVRLRNLNITAIYSSPLDRAVETAQPLADAIHLPVEHRERLTEVRFGGWQGRSFEDLSAENDWRRFNSFRSSTRPEGGELMLDVQSRVVDELEDLRQQHGQAVLALFSHADVIKAAIAHYAGVPLDLFHRIEIAPASVSTLRLSEHGAVILGVNDTGTLLSD